MTNIYVTLQKIFGILSICLLVIGTTGNLLSFYICLRIKNNSTFTFITFLVIADLLTLYYWNLNNFLSQFTQINLLSVNLWVCKFGNFLQFTSLQCSAWILVSFFEFLTIGKLYFLNLSFIFLKGLDLLGSFF